MREQDLVPWFGDPVTRDSDGLTAAPSTPTHTDSPAQQDGHWLTLNPQPL